MVRIRLPYGGDAWLVRRYDDVRAVYRDPRFSRAATIGADVPRVTPEVNELRAIVYLDPPDHTRLHRLIVRAFSAKQVATMRGRIERIVEELLDGMEVAGPGPVDLMAGLSWPLAITGIAELLGIPAEARAVFDRWAEVTSIADPDRQVELKQVLDDVWAGLTELIAERRQRPQDDLISELVRCRDEDGSLSEDELTMFVMSMLIAGHDTTAYQLGNFVYTLLRHPDQLAELLAEPRLVGNAVEELLRHTPFIAASQASVALEDVPLSCGVVRAGETVYVDAAAANRDPLVFDRPDELDVTRAGRPHLGFGDGPHHCSGAQFARLQLTVGLRLLLQRFPGLTLGVPWQEVAWRKGVLLRGLESLPVTW